MALAAKDLEARGPRRIRPGHPRVIPEAAYRHPLARQLTRADVEDLMQDMLFSRGPTLMPRVIRAFLRAEGPLRLQDLRTQIKATKLTMLDMLRQLSNEGIIREHDGPRGDSKHPYSWVLGVLD